MGGYRSVVLGLKGSMVEVVSNGSIVVLVVIFFWAKPLCGNLNGGQSRQSVESEDLKN